MVDKGKYQQDIRQDTNKYKILKKAINVTGNPIAATASPPHNTYRRRYRRARIVKTTADCDAKTVRITLAALQKDVMPTFYDYVQ